MIVNIPAEKIQWLLPTTILYIACSKTSEYISQDELAKHAGVTDVTIKNTTKRHEIKKFSVTKYTSIIVTHFCWKDLKRLKYQLRYLNYNVYSYLWEKPLLYTFINAKRVG